MGIGDFIKDTLHTAGSLALPAQIAASRSPEEVDARLQQLAKEKKRWQEEARRQALIDKLSQIDEPTYRNLANAVLEYNPSTAAELLGKQATINLAEQKAAEERQRTLSGYSALAPLLKDRFGVEMPQSNGDVNLDPTAINNVLEGIIKAKNVNDEYSLKERLQKERYGAEKSLADTKGQWNMKQAEAYARNRGGGKLSDKEIQKKAQELLVKRAQERQRLYQNGLTLGRALTANPNPGAALWFKNQAGGDRNQALKMIAESVIASTGGDREKAKALLARAIVNFDKALTRYNTGHFGAH